VRPGGPRPREARRLHGGAAAAERDGGRDGAPAALHRDAHALQQGAPGGAGRRPAPALQGTGPLRSPRSLQAPPAAALPRSPHSLTPRPSAPPPCAAPAAAPLPSPQELKEAQQQDPDPEYKQAVDENSGSRAARPCMRGQGGSMAPDSAARRACSRPRPLSARPKPAPRPALSRCARRAASWQSSSSVGGRVPGVNACPAARTPPTAHPIAATPHLSRPPRPPIPPAPPRPTPRSQVPGARVRAAGGAAAAEGAAGDWRA
jgi:hypothetical protein